MRYIADSKRSLKTSFKNQVIKYSWTKKLKKALFGCLPVNWFKKSPELLFQDSTFPHFFKIKNSKSSFCDHRQFWGETSHQKIKTTKKPPWRSGRPNNQFIEGLYQTNFLASGLRTTWSSAFPRSLHSFWYRTMQLQRRWKRSRHTATPI